MRGRLIKPWREKVTRELLIHGCNPNIRNIQGHTPLHSMVEGSGKEAQQLGHLLIQHGAHVELRDARGKDIWQYAREWHGDALGERPISAWLESLPRLPRLECLAAQVVAEEIDCEDLRSWVPEPIMQIICEHSP